MSDYISKEDLAKIIMEESNDYGIGTTTERIWRRIKTHQNADVKEVVHGEWIPKESTTNEWDIDIVCSRCGYVGIEGYAHGYELNEIDIKKVRDYTKKLDMNFCTCCGANMKGR